MTHFKGPKSRDNVIDFIERRESRFVLDTFSVASINAWAKRHAQLKDLARRVFYHYAGLRSQHFDDLKLALQSQSKPVLFDQLVRIVDFQFSNTPVSARGSISTTEGGRFNYGKFNEAEFAPFPALYVACSYPTAFAEKYGQSENENPRIDTADLILSPNRANSFVRLSLTAERCLDLRDHQALDAFVEIIRPWKLSREILRDADRAEAAPPFPITSVQLLLSQLEDPHWRRNPWQVALPSNSQIFGQLAKAAGIDAIIYSSVKSDGYCVAVFPDNVPTDKRAVQLLDPAFPGCSLDLI